MQARIVGAGRGLRWLAEGWRLFRAAPLGWLALVFAYWLMMTLVSLAPYVGVAAASVLVPAFSVGFLAAARAASHRGGVQLALLFDGFRQAPAAQLVLGVVYFACLALVLAASALADDGALARWMLTGGRPADEVLQSDEFVMALACAAALYTPVMMMFWFAPPLAAWHSVGAAKALFFSFFACLMNWRRGDRLTHARLAVLRSSDRAKRCRRFAGHVADLPAPRRAPADPLRELLRELPRRVRQRGMKRYEARLGGRFGSARRKNPS